MSTKCHNLLFFSRLQPQASTSTSANLFRIFIEKTSKRWTNAGVAMHEAIAGAEPDKVNDLHHMANVVQLADRIELRARLAAASLRVKILNGNP